MTDRHELSDTQLLQEVALNERVVTHPKLGKIVLRMPTLETQRKIDAVARSKKKFLKDAKDTITDEAGAKRIVPAFKSREQLEREYAELGWWTDAEKLKLADLSEQHVQLLAELELLGFESDIGIYTGIQGIQAKLGDLSKDDHGQVPTAVTEALNRLIVPGATVAPSDVDIIRDHTATTQVDDLFESLKVYHRQYLAYIKLAKVYADLINLQSQQLTLFSDSWQDQLQYFVRLAQVHYCTELQEQHKPIWESIEAIESEQDITLVRWIFGELNAYWQGITDDTREKMDKYSFTSPRSTENSDSVDSPAPQESSLGGEPQVSAPTSSTAVTVTQAPLPTPTLSLPVGSGSTTGP